MPLPAIQHQHGLPICIWVSFLLISYSGKIQIWEFTEKGNKTTESLVFPQFKNEIMPKEKDEKEQTLGEEIYTLACSKIKSVLYAAGNQGKIYVIEVQKTGTAVNSGVLKVL
jgi:hypothetical protein